MRTMVAALAVSAFAAGLAYGQYKPTTPAPTAGSAPIASSGPVQITQSGSPAAAPAVDPNAEAKRIQRAEAIKMVKAHKAAWVDVRPKDQYELGHIPGAINIPLGELMTRLRDLPVKKYIITYCA